MKLTEEQRELIALIPKAIRKSKEYTDATKLVLGQIDFMHGTDFAEVNGYVFCSNDKMSEETGVSVSQVKRVVKILVNEGLITTQRGNRTKEGKESSKYWLTDLYYELANRPKPKNEPLIGGQNESEEKNEPLDIELEKEPETDINNMLEYTCTGEDNSKNQHNMKYNDEFITENDRGAWEVLSMDDNFEYTQYSDIAEMVKRDAGNKGVKNELSDFDKKNEWCTWAYDELKHLIQILYESWEPSNVLSYANKINSLFDEVDEHINQGWFTKKQIAKFDGMVNNFNSIIRKKSELIDGTGTEQSSVSNENNITSISTSDSEHCPSPAAASQVTKEQYLNALRKVFIDEEGWTLKTFYAKSGFGLHEYMKRVADILGINVDRINNYKFENEVKTILSNDMTVEEPKVN